MPETTSVPTPDRKPGWQAARVAYQEQRRAGAAHHWAWLAADYGRRKHLAYRVERQLHVRSGLEAGTRCGSFQNAALCERP
jgi:hypothetical protein